MAPRAKLELATSRYHAAPLIEESGLAPLGITVGAARWLNYELAGSVGMLAPYGEVDRVPLREMAPEKFEAAYRQRLDYFGAAPIAQVLQAFANAWSLSQLQSRFGCVLLCFENVLDGEDCHRRTFAAWWQERTGDEVPELGQ